MTIDELKKLNSLETIEITAHAFRRLEQRDISITEIVECINCGEIIEQYPDSYPYPSCLVFGSLYSKRILHAVVGSDGERLWIITAYEPSADKFEMDMKTRKEAKK